MALTKSGERCENTKTEFESFLDRSLGYYKQKQSDSWWVSLVDFGKVDNK